MSEVGRESEPVSLKGPVPFGFNSGPGEPYAHLKLGAGAEVESTASRYERDELPLLYPAVRKNATTPLVSRHFVNAHFSNLVND